MEVHLYNPTLTLNIAGKVWDTENFVFTIPPGIPAQMMWQFVTAAVSKFGKRLPTPDEIFRLCEMDSTWDKSCNGRWFGGNHATDRSGSLFLPAEGCFNVKTNQIEHKRAGYYWSSASDSGHLIFNWDNIYPDINTTDALCFSVRCVQDKKH